MIARTMSMSSAFLRGVALLSMTAAAPSVAYSQDAATLGQPTSEAQACIGIVLPSAQGIDGDATTFGNSLRELFMSYLTGPSLRAIALDARLASQAIEEARQKECGHVLLTSVTRERDDGNQVGRALGRAAGTAAVYTVPYGGSAASAAARGAAIAGAYAISDMAATTRAKDKLTLEYRLGTVDTAIRATPKSEKAKARNDGEDLLTPLVEKAAEAVAAIVLKR